MNFWQYIKESKDVDLDGVSDVIAGQFSAMTIRGHSISDLLAHYSDDFGHLPAAKLQELAQGHRRWQAWRKRQQLVIKARVRDKLPPFPVEIFQKTPTMDQLAALLRMAQICPLEAAGSDEAWQAALCAGVELWTRCLRIAMKNGLLRTEAVDLERPESARYDAYARYSEVLDQIAPHRWLAIRRGEKEGILRLKLELPEDEFLESVARFQEQLGPAAAGREPREVLQELVLGDMDPWVRHVMNTGAQGQAIDNATESLTGLLRAAPAKVQKLSAIYFTRPGALVAMVVVDPEGELLAHRVGKVQGSWLEKVKPFLEEHQVQNLVIPTSIPEAELLGKLEDHISAEGIDLIKIRPAALSEAREPLTSPPLRLGKMVASAMVLARRALDPMKEWSRVDPVSIGLAEYQNDLDADLLRLALTETVELCRLERRRGKRVSMGAAINQGSSAMARLNPLVKQFSDLRAGMTVQGVVTNISHFGAFVNIGLPQEGLVHISALSDEFVSNPNDVVSIGQHVSAHVLSVDLGRGRISLSMKSASSVRLDDRDRSRSGHSSRPSRESNISKSQALADLEKLFKK